MTQDQAKHDDARTAPEQPQPQIQDESPAANSDVDVSVTDYRVTIRDDYSADIMMRLDVPEGRVILVVIAHARDEPGRITRTITIGGPGISTVIREPELPEWRPSNPDVPRDDRAFRAAINTEFVNRATDWYEFYREHRQDDESGDRR